MHWRGYLAVANARGVSGHHPPMSVWIDTHCHLDAPEFNADRDAVRRSAAAQGVVHCVIPAVERGNWHTVRAMAHQYKDSYALGIHPLYTGRAADEDLQALEQALVEHQADPRLVAVGEIGLDFFVTGLDAARQERFYRAQLQLARRFDLPVILHVRRSADRLLKGLRELPVQGGIAHAFNGSLQQAQAFIAMGFRLGFGGAMTYDRALQLRRLAAQLPVDALVLETDAPDIPPTGSTPRLRHALPGRPRVAIHRASCRASPVCWPRCAVHWQMTSRPSRTPTRCGRCPGLPLCSASRLPLHRRAPGCRVRRRSCHLQHPALRPRTLSRLAGCRGRSRCQCCLLQVLWLTAHDFQRRGAVHGRGVAVTPLRLSAGAARAHRPLRFRVLWGARLRWSAVCRLNPTIRCVFPG